MQWKTSIFSSSFQKNVIHVLLSEKQRLGYSKVLYTCHGNDTETYKLVSNDIIACYHLLRSPRTNFVVHTPHEGTQQNMVMHTIVYF